MRIGIDYTSAEIAPAGIGYVTKELTNQLQNQADLTVFTTRSSGLANEVVIPRKRLPGAGLIWMWQVGRYCRLYKIDYLVSPTALTFPLFFGSVIQVVNDLSPIYFKAGFTFKQRLVYRLGLNVSAKFARGLIFISKTIQSEFNARYTSKANQTYSLLGLNNFLTQNLSSERISQISQELNLPEKYFCSVSTIEPRKNYAGMVRGFAEFSRQHPDYYYLIIGKNGWMSDSLQGLVKQLGLQDKVRFLGYATDAQKLVVLKNASGFLYLSFYEGFGLPNIEAYALGISVLTSDIPIMREVMQDKAYYANPKDFVDIGNKMKLLISTKKEVDQKFLQRFSWNNFAKEVMSLCR